MADTNELEVDEELDKKKKNKKDKKKEKVDKKKKGKDSDDTVEEESKASKFVMFLVTLLIIVVWMGILAVLIKADVGGFGSTVLAPALKNVPVINKILPDSASDAAIDMTESSSPYATLDDALDRIKELEVELDAANTQIESDSSQISELSSQVSELSIYKQEQDTFEEEKEKFYEEVVFSDNAPDIEEYKTYYESIDSENAEVLYKQVVEQIEENNEITEYAQTYADMKPKEAAEIFNNMTDNLQLVADILNAMDSTSRANILGKMDSDTAAKVTKIMNPS